MEFNLGTSAQHDSHEALGYLLDHGTNTSIHSTFKVFEDKVLNLDGAKVLDR